MRKTRLIIDSNPMLYLLNHHLIQGCISKLIIILQDSDLRFMIPNSTKALELAHIITNLPSESISSSITDHLPNEHLFTIAFDKPWYGDMLTYLRTQNFIPHLIHVDHHHIRHRSALYLPIDDVLYR